MDGLKPGSLDGLVDIERGIVSREIFVSEEIYRQELDQVFARAWLFVSVSNINDLARPGPPRHAGEGRRAPGGLGGNLT